MVMAWTWCHQVTSHYHDYLKQCWPRSMLWNDAIRPQWVNALPQQKCHHSANAILLPVCQMSHAGHIFSMGHHQQKSVRPGSAMACSWRVKDWLYSDSLEIYFFYETGVYTKFSGWLSKEPFTWLIQKFPCVFIFKTGHPGCHLNLSERQIRLDLTSGRPLV